MGGAGVDRPSPLTVRGRSANICAASGRAKQNTTKWRSSRYSKWGRGRRERCGKATGGLAVREAAHGLVGMATWSGHGRAS
jgi:hypothetical protein